MPDDQLELAGLRTWLFIDVVLVVPFLNHNKHVYPPLIHMHG